MEKKISHKNKETVHAKHQVVKWDNPFICAQAQCGPSQHERKVKTLPGEMAKPFFLEQSVHFAKSREVKWKIPFFGVQTPRGQSQRKEGCKTPQGKVDRESNFQCTRHIFASIATTLVQKYRRIHFRKRSMAAKQTLRWQILAPSGTSGTSLMGAPSTEDPQLTSKVVFLVLKQERFDESGCKALAA